MCVDIYKYEKIVGETLIQHKIKTTSISHTCGHYQWKTIGRIVRGYYCPTCNKQNIKYNNHHIDIFTPLCRPMRDTYLHTVSPRCQHKYVSL